MSTVEKRPENSLHQLVVHTWVQTLRLLVRWRHDPQTVIQALVLPCAFLVSLNLVSASRFREPAARMRCTAPYRWPLW